MVNLWEKAGHKSFQKPCFCISSILALQLDNKLLLSTSKPASLLWKFYMSLE